MEFNKAYNRQEFVNFLQNSFLPDDFIPGETPVEFRTKMNYTRQAVKLGSSESLDLIVYEVRHISKNDARVSLSKEAFRLLADEMEDRALVIFVPQDNSDNYRFSLIEITLEAKADSSRVTRNYSNPRRYSYYLGEGIAVHTPKEYLLKKTRVQSVSDLKSRFSVEILNENFFKEYKAQYTRFCDFLQQDPEMRQSFMKYKDQGKAIRDYVKKMMGRIVFLYFVQRKGWLNGDYRYMSNLYTNSSDAVKADFLDKVLEPMFFGLLNTPVSERVTSAKRHDWDLSLIPGWENIPYLNGGLFEQDDIDKCRSVFPQEYFKQLFEFFDTYNFTIDENDPDDNEVGIDPEMLGHIFENLLEDNKDKGAFYTPKEIVQYMCRQSVIQYLKSHEPDEQYASAIELLINDGIVSPELQKKDVAVRFTQLLRGVKVCDPAIGSGAFPMGILYVLYYSIHNLHPHVDPHGDFNSVQTKREIIQNNIFGVDIEQGAVDIARLRFWLALVVDAHESEPLPNLDYKIMCGNSQIYRYRIDVPIETVFEEYNLAGREKARKDKTEWTNLTLESYRALVSSYTEEHDDKKTLRDKILEIKNYFKTTLAKGDIRKRKAIEAKIVEYESIPLFGSRKANEDPQGYALAKRQLQQAKSKENEILNNAKYKDSVEWRFEYPQLLDDKGNFIGFDIIIANPPYIKEGRMSKVYFEPYKDSPYYQGKMDIWYLFACNSLDLLNPNGILCFIATNNWVTSFGARKLRNKVIKETRICNLLDFGAVMMFESASIQTMIMIFQKDRVTNDYTFDYRKMTANKATEKDAIAVLTKNATNAEYYTPIVRRETLVDKPFSFSRNGNILEQIANVDNCIYLNNKELAQGIVFPQDTLNKRNQEKLGKDFIVGTGIYCLTTDELTALNLSSNEEKLIKPYYTTDQIKQYYVDPQNTKWIIYTDSSYKKENSLNDFPHIKAHLDKYKSIFTSDNKPYGLHRAREERFFIGEKVIAVRKCPLKPIFAYSDGTEYVSATFYIIKTDRVNLKYLTGLLNSQLIKYWLKNKGKMQGSNYQLDKEPLQQIPIAVPSAETHNLIAILVDHIRLLLGSNERAYSHTPNSFIARHFESLINGCVYEIYFKAHMQELGISIIEHLTDYIETLKESRNNIQKVWTTYKQLDDTGILHILNSLESLSPDLLNPIIRE